MRGGGVRPVSVQHRRKRYRRGSGVRPARDHGTAARTPTVAVVRVPVSVPQTRAQLRDVLFREPDLLHERPDAAAAPEVFEHPVSAFGGTPQRLQYFGAIAMGVADQVSIAQMLGTDGI